MISVVIPSFNRASVATGVVSALLNQTIFLVQKCEIIISIDESDDQVEIYKDYVNQLRQIYSQSRPNVDVLLLINNTKGLVNAKNRAVKESKYEYIMMMDDDLILESNYIQEIYDDIISDENIGATSGYIVTFKPAISHTQPSNIIESTPVISHLQTLNMVSTEGEWRSAFGKKEQVMDWSLINKSLDKKTRYTMDYFVNSYMFRKSAFTRINGYNVGLNSKTSAHEEVDFTYRMNKAGYRLLFNPFARMWHWTIGKGGIYKGNNWAESKKILEQEYKDSLDTFMKSVSKE